MPPLQKIRRSLRNGLKLAEVRFRMPLILLISAVVVGRWDAIRNHWDRLTHLAVPRSSTVTPVSSDTEYFCPMDPGVVSAWPGKCGICNMDFVRRRRGEAAALPDGVVARMQFTPYRIQLAGIRTTPLDFETLDRTYQTAGVVRKHGNELSVPFDIPRRHSSWLWTCQNVTIQCRDGADSRPTTGKLHLHQRPSGQGSNDLGATVVISESTSSLQPGMIVDVTCRVPVAGLEPFRSLPTGPPPLKPDEMIRLYACPEHPEILESSAGQCTIDGNELQERRIASAQRIRWWCPSHPAITADHSGVGCRQCDGMMLKPRVVTYRPPGKVLVVPESAVVETGTRTIVFIETMPGMFDGVQVELGSRCGDFYPVVRGLEPGQRVVIAGAFLLDAETRLNPSLASSYFGARSRAGDLSAPGATTRDPATDRSGLATLDRQDRLLAERQRICPVTGKRLGSMGTPARVLAADRVVFLCCSGCEDAFAAEPARYLAVLAVQPKP
jgi:hypothetical protein